MPASLLATCKSLVLLTLLLWLGACAQRQPLPAALPYLPEPSQWLVQSQHSDEQQTWLLVVQREQDALRFSLFNPLGVPLARQLLRDQTWQADGLLPPFAPARELFAATLFALTPAEQLSSLYPLALAGPPRMLSGHWQVESLAPSGWLIRTPSRTYHLTPIATEPSR